MVPLMLPWQGSYWLAALIMQSWTTFLNCQDKTHKTRTLPISWEFCLCVVGFCEHIDHCQYRRKHCYSYSKRRSGDWNFVGITKPLSPSFLNLPCKLSCKAKCQKMEDVVIIQAQLWHWIFANFGIWYLVSYLLLSYAACPFSRQRKAGSIASGQTCPECALPLTQCQLELALV